MKSILPALIIASLAVTAHARPIKDQYILIAHQDEGLDRSQIKLLKSYGIKIKHLYKRAIKGLAFNGDKDIAAQIDSLPGFSVIQDGHVYLSPNTSRGRKPSIQPAQSIPWGIKRVGGFVNCEINNCHGRAWVIDSGIDLDHPDLNVDTKFGFSAFTKGKDSTLEDLNGHGTHVAGTIAAKDNDIGVVGVAAGATVIPVKVLGRSGSGSWSGIIAGIEHVMTYGQPGDIANMSIGGGISPEVDEAILNAAATGIKFVLAAGNESDDAAMYSPARVNGTNIYTISAMDDNDEFARFSNFGPGVDYTAPGVEIPSLWKGGGYNSISGTSMAAPHVSGILLLGDISSDGYVKNDPDGVPDPIASSSP